MGCNCGGTKSPGPRGAGKPAEKDEPVPAMATASAKRQSFQLELPSGRTQTFGSKLEAEAARIRMGGRLVLP